MMQGKSNFAPLLSQISRSQSYSAQGLIAAPKMLRKQSKVYIFVTKTVQSYRKHFLRHSRASDTYSTLGRTSTPNTPKIGKIVCFCKMFFMHKQLRIFLKMQNKVAEIKGVFKFTLEIWFGHRSATDSNPH